MHNSFTRKAYFVFCSAVCLECLFIDFLKQLLHIYYFGVSFSVQFISTVYLLKLYSKSLRSMLCISLQCSHRHWLWLFFAPCQWAYVASVRCFQHCVITRQFTACNLPSHHAVDAWREFVVSVWPSPWSCWGSVANRCRCIVFISVAISLCYIALQYDNSCVILSDCLVSQFMWLVFCVHTNLLLRMKHASTTSILSQNNKACNGMNESVKIVISLHCVTQFF